MEEKTFLCKFIDRHQERFIGISQEIWQFAELPRQEYRSSERLIEELVRAGFAIKRGVGGIDTSFVAVFGKGFPRFGFLGEYDALDGLSQKAASPVKESLISGGAGHGCGHNLLGAGSLAAAIAVKEYLKATGKEGTVYYFGCAAEEGIGAKTFMADAGLFDDIDFIYTWHPSTVNEVQSSRNVAITSADFTFQGKTAHAGSSPWLGRSALDAAELMNIGCNYLREHMLDQERIHYAYLDAGSTAANVVTERSVIRYEVRSPRRKDLKRLFERVIRVAEGAAMMTETHMEYEVTMRFADYWTNPVLADIAGQALQEIGAPQWDEADGQLANAFLSTYDEQTLEQARQDISERYAREALEQKLRFPLDDQVRLFVENDQPYNSGSTDVGDVCYACPTLNFHIATQCLGNVGHTWQNTAQSNSTIGHKGMLTAAKVMALAAVRTMDQPQIIEAAKREVLRRKQADAVE